MTAKIIEILVMEGVAILMFIFAYQIGIKGRLNFIAGYNERTANKVTDKEGFKRLITRFCVLLGFGSAMMPLLTQVLSTYPCGIAYTTGGYGGFILGVVGMVMLQTRDYTS